MTVKLSERNWLNAAYTEPRGQKHWDEIMRLGAKTAAELLVAAMKVDPADRAKKGLTGHAGMIAIGDLHIWESPFDGAFQQMQFYNPKFNDQNVHPRNAPIATMPYKGQYRLNQWGVMGAPLEPVDVSGLDVRQLQADINRELAPHRLAAKLKLWFSTETSGPIGQIADADVLATVVRLPKHNSTPKNGAA